MAAPRRLLVDPAKTGVFHCVSRCVHRAFLCGRDSSSGGDYEHRKAWIRDQLRELADLFAVEIYSYAVMSNHLHLVVRTLPGQVEGWDDEEIARRWLQLFPGPGKRRKRESSHAIEFEGAACLRLVSAIPMEISDEWEGSAAHLLSPEVHCRKR